MRFCRLASLAATLSLLICGTAPYTVLAQPAAHGAQSRHGSITAAAGSANTTAASAGARAVSAGPGSPASTDEAALKLFKPVEQVANEWLRRPELYHSLVGLEIMDVPSGRVLFNHNGNKRFVTASIAKVLTTACAYDTFGGDFRYHTALIGYGDIRNARLSGSLAVVPSQDPSFERKDLHTLLGGLQTRGIKFISGRVYIQPVSGGGDHFATEWLIQDWGQDWMPASSDFILDRNILAGDAGGGYPVVNASSATEANSLTRSLLQAPWGPSWVVFNKSSNTVTFYRPDIPVNGGIVVGNPTEYNAAMVRIALKGMGIHIDGHEGGEDGSPIPLGDHVSEPLSEILRYCLKHSDNLYAQQLLRTLGSLAPLDKRYDKASLEERGLVRLHAWLSGAGIPADEVVIYDGCGLSRKNAITPHAFNLVLRHMSGASGNGPYIDLLLHQGEGNVRTWRFKTGAMDSVRSISGIVKTSTGQPLAVTAIVNDHEPQVGELRTSLGNLIGRLEALGSIKLTPVPQPAKHAGRSRAHAVAGPQAGTTVTTFRHRRRRR